MTATLVVRDRVHHAAAAGGVQHEFAIEANVGDVHIARRRALDVVAVAVRVDVTLEEAVRVELEERAHVEVVHHVIVHLLDADELEATLDGTDRDFRVAVRRSLRLQRGGSHQSQLRAA